MNWKNIFIKIFFCVTEAFLIIELVIAFNANSIKSLIYFGAMLLFIGELDIICSRKEQ